MIKLNMLAILKQGYLGKDGLTLLRFGSVFYAGHDFLGRPLGHSSKLFIFQL